MISDSNDINERNTYLSWNWGQVQVPDQPHDSLWASCGLLS